MTDHLWDASVAGASEWYAPQTIAHIEQNLPLPAQKGTEFLFGCEVELDRHFTLSLAKENFDRFDFVIIPTTHLHMSGLTRPKGAENDVRAELYVKRLCAVLDMELPFRKIGIAHLACSLMAKERRPQDVLSQIPDGALIPLFERAAEKGVGIELNAADFCFPSFPEEQIRATLHLFDLAKRAGCKFYLGSDAHHPCDLDGAMPCFQQAIDALGLEEEHKFLPHRCV